MTWVDRVIRNNPELADLPIARRARNSIHLRKPGGENVALISPAPIHYLDGKEWKEISTALQYDAESGEYHAPGLPVRLTLDRLTKIGAYSQHTKRVGLWRPSEHAFIGQFDLPKGTIEGDSLVASGDWWEHRIRVTDIGLEETLTITKKKSILGARVTDWLVLETAISGRVFSDGAVDEYKYEDGKFPPPVATDANGNQPECKRFARTIDGVQYLYTGIPLSWLATAEYPVVIDPDYTGATSDAYIVGTDSATWSTARGTSASYDDGSWLLVLGTKGDAGYLVYRGYVSFDTSSIPDTDEVTDVKLRMTIYSQASDNLYISEYDWSEWAGDKSNATKRETAWDGALAATDKYLWGNCGSIATNTPTEGASMTNSYVSKTGTTYYALLTEKDKNDSAPSGWFRPLLYSHNYSDDAAYRPILVVTYSTPSTPEGSSRIISDLRGTRKNQFNIKPASALGAPSSGTYMKGDIHIDADGVIRTCITAGTPGTWREIARATDFYEKTEFLDEGGGLPVNAGSPIKLGETGEISYTMIPAVSTSAKGAIDALPDDPAQFFNGEGDWAGGREKLTGNRTYYVRTDGNDSNDGLTNTSGGAFATIQHAINTVCDDLDLSEASVTIQVGAGTYNENVTLRRYLASYGGARITLQGDTTTPSNVVISTSSGNCITASYLMACSWAIAGFKLVASSGSGIAVAWQSQVHIYEMEYGACSSRHIDVTYGAIVYLREDYTISGSAAYHIMVNGQAMVLALSSTVTLTGTPAFTYFTYVTRGGQLYIVNNTYSGSATGARYYVNLNSAIDTGASGATYLPGDTLGVTATGGQYN